MPLRQSPRKRWKNSTSRIHRLWFDRLSAEPGRLAATRRKREYFNSQSNLRSQTGFVDVVMIGDQGAVACYTFQFHATKVAANV